MDSGPYLPWLLAFWLCALQRFSEREPEDQQCRATRCETSELGFRPGLPGLPGPA
eukprot:CAMPEP_0204425974 /NCGR_PEP_ID=MMETSP0470-20130426/50952_1 /ASSEMBLY_ACC=CAM_ASM_000385 /TAXON_ID=2969 /ORGANISM="Oxyrrhis marina" /LENGTH=54 /DNA_ID=CAMNT_0051423633 /DNA_START=80 /DNA_END=241 /DNA_ORIENTATION=-